VVSERSLTVHKVGWFVVKADDTNPGSVGLGMVTKVRLNLRTNECCSLCDRITSVYKSTQNIDSIITVLTQDNHNDNAVSLHIKTEEQWLDLYRCTSVGTAWLPDTRPSSADLAPTSTVISICDLLTVASWTLRKSDCRCMEDVHLVTQDCLLVTFFLTLSKATHFLCLLLDASLNISTSRSTSTPSAFEIIYT